jgi:hypothetical protein
MCDYTVDQALEIAQRVQNSCITGLKQRHESGILPATKKSKSKRSRKKQAQGFSQSIQRSRLAYTLSAPSAQFSEKNEKQSSHTKSNTMFSSIATNEARAKGKSSNRMRKKNTLLPAIPGVLDRISELSTSGTHTDVDRAIKQHCDSVLSIINDLGEKYQKQQVLA